MNLSEIKKKISQERNFGSRFPVRIIFVENLNDYYKLEDQLKGVCDVTLNVASFCRASDTVPQFDVIIKQLKEYEGKHILLLSVGEYLRLCAKREFDPNRRQFRDFWEHQQPEASKTRIIVPVFNCRDIFDRITYDLDERQLVYIWTFDSHSSDERYDISVYSPIFKESITPDATNITDWFNNWQHLLKKNTACSVITSQYHNVEHIFGTVNIKPIDSPFRYLADNLKDGNELNENWLDNDFCNRAISYISKHHKDTISFKSLALDALNVTEFEFISIAARWNTLDDYQKDLVWLWYRVYPTEEYYSHACRKASCSSEIPEKIRDEILLISNRSERWIEERMKAVSALHINRFNESYFALIDTLPLDETKLRLLTYKTNEEKTYAVKVISNLLRDGAEPSTIASDLLESVYPSLASYMKDESGCDQKIDEYMAWYRKNKLINRYPGEPPIEIDLESFDTRCMLTHKLHDHDCAFFWIDGFGVEYCPVFIHELKVNDIIPESVKLGTAILPTETEYNHQWNKNDTKWDILDSLSHHGMPDDKSYYSCIVQQLSVFSDAAEEVKKLLKNHEYVVITGDHGSSRLAALAFHENNVVPISAPKNSKIHACGRFCELENNTEETFFLPNIKLVASNEKKYLIMNNYQHFSVGGNAAGGNTDNNDVVGEIHGGNTVEERLVPVIVIKRKQPLPPITCKPRSSSVTRKNGHIEVTLEFSHTVSTLQVSQNNNETLCEKITDKSWLIKLDNVLENNIILTVIANGYLLPDVFLKIKSQGISKSEPFDRMGL